MRVCPKCGYKEEVPWENSRFDYNAEYIRFDEAPLYPTLVKVLEALKDKPNFHPFEFKGLFYYRRGTGGIYLYRCLPEDFRVPRERKRHTLSKFDKNQTKLLEVKP